MKKAKKKFETSVVSIVTLLASVIGLVSIGFSSWNISHSDNATTQGEVAADAVVYFSGVRISSITSFTCGHYSFGNSSTFSRTGEITYTICVTPYSLDDLSKSALRTEEGLTLYAKFNSLFAVFNKANGNYTIFEGVDSDGDPSLTNITNCIPTEDYNEIYFSFTIPQMTDSQLNSGAGVSFDYNLTFTFNNRLLLKDYGVDADDNPLTILDNKFTLYLGKEAF